MAQLTELGYMGIGVKDLAAWKEFATEVVGLELVDEGERGRCYLRMDYWHHRLVLHEDRSDDVLYLGWRVAGGEEFAEMQQQLSAAGIRFRVGSEEEAAERRVLEILKLEDPDGHPTEIFHGPEVQFAKPFHPGRRMHGRFKTGAGGARPLHSSPEGHEGCVPILPRARHARRRRIQGRDGTARAHADCSCTATSATTRSPSGSAGRSAGSTTS